MKTEWIDLDSIEIAEGRRPVDPAHVKRLAASITEIGLQTPLTVMARKDVDGWRSILVAGAHRLEALRLNGEDGADCFILPDDQDTADLWEIDENFARAELTDAQRADHHKRRADIMARLKLVAPLSEKAGRPLKSENLSKYSAVAAAQLGVDERTVRNDLRRATKIEADVLAEVAGTALDKGVVLDELARTPQADQHDKLAEIAARRRQPKAAGLAEAWAGAGEPARALFLDAIDAASAPTLRDLLFLFYCENPDQIVSHGNEPEADASMAVDSDLTDARARGGDLTALARAFADDDRPTARAIARLLARVALV